MRNTTQSERIVPDRLVIQEDDLVQEVGHPAQDEDDQHHHQHLHHLYNMTSITQYMTVLKVYPTQVYNDRLPTSIPLHVCTRPFYTKVFCVVRCACCVVHWPTLVAYLYKGHN